MIFEDKDYSNVKQVFKVQNLAIVSNANRVKIQIILDKLVKRKIKSSNITLTSLKNLFLIIFAIFSKGLQYKFWVHYTIINYGEQQVNIMFLNISDGVMLKQVTSFL